MKRTLIKHEPGFATIASVVMVSVLLVTSLTSIYVFQMNNIRFQKRVKETHKLMGVMEEAAKVVRGAWDRGAASVADPSDLNAVSAEAYTQLMDMVNTNPAAMLCIRNPDRPTAAPANCTCPGQAGAANPPDYCFAPPANMQSASNWDFKMPSTPSPLEGSRIERFIAKLDAFFDGQSLRDMNSIKGDIFLRPPTVVGWLMVESQAFGFGSSNAAGALLAPRVSHAQGLPTCPENCPGDCSTQCQCHPVCQVRNKVTIPNTQCEDGNPANHHSACQECGAGSHDPAAGRIGSPCMSLSTTPEMFGGQTVAQRYLIVPAGRQE